MICDTTTLFLYKILAFNNKYVEGQRIAEAGRRDDQQKTLMMETEEEAYVFEGEGESQEEDMMESQEEEEEEEEEEDEDG
ncbi:hypothetical protein Tco_0628459 [Tanacetum coccineum]|uniref:Uncharacterized protein n=1 Tax=Tanacetum coccineum TaxID=301880 RepID=A0ABQ4WQC8_9ASTR